MKSILKNRILIWSMYFIAFWCMGLWAVAMWTGVQISIYFNEKEKFDESEKRQKERLEKGVGLTQNDLMILGYKEVLYEIAPGVWVFERRKDERFRRQGNNRTEGGGGVIEK